MKKSVLLLLVLLLLFSSISFSATKTIRFATLNWEPYYGEKLKDYGFIAAITKEAFQRAGYNVTFSFIPWKRALEDAKSGTYDGLLGAYYSDERNQDFVFTEPIGNATISLFKLKETKLPGGNTYNSLQDLKNYSIGIVRGYVNSSEFDNASYLKKEEAVNTQININKLLNKRVDLIVESRENLFYILSTQFSKDKNKVEELSPPLEENKIYNAITRKLATSKEIVDNFNKELNEMKKDGTYVQILQEHGQM